MAYSLLTSILAVAYMIPLLLVVAAILWILALLFETIAPYLSLPLKATPPPASAPVKPTQSQAVLGASKTRIAPLPAPLTDVPVPTSELPASSQLADPEETDDEDNAYEFQPAEATTETQLAAETSDDDDDNPDPYGDDDEENGETDEPETAELSGGEERTETEVAPDVDEAGDFQPIPATMASQLPPPPAVDYELLHMDSDAIQQYPLGSFEPGPVDPPAHAVEQYARRLNTVRTAAFDIARVVRNKTRHQSPEQLATQLFGLIEYYQLLADMNVKRIIDQAHERSRQTYDEHIELFFRIQNACISGELEAVQDEPDDTEAGQDL